MFFQNNKVIVKNALFPYFDNKTLANFSQTSKENNKLIKESRIYKQRKHDYDIIPFFKNTKNSYTELLTPFFEDIMLLKEKAALIHIYLFSKTEKKYLCNKIYPDQLFDTFKFRLKLIELRSTIKNEILSAKKSQRYCCLGPIDPNTLQNISQTAKLLIPIDHQTNEISCELTLPNNCIRGSTLIGTGYLTGMAFFLSISPAVPSILPLLGFIAAVNVINAVVQRFAENTLKESAKKVDEMSKELCNFIQKNFAYALLDQAEEGNNQTKDACSMMTYYK